MFKPIVAIAAVSLLAISVASAQDANPLNHLSPEARAKATRLYAQECALCHNDNGNGKSDLASSMKLQLPDFTRSDTLAAKSDAALFNTIRNGKGQMPAEAADRANDNAVWGLILYLRSLGSGAAAAAPATDAAPAAPQQ